MTPVDELLFRAQRHTAEREHLAAHARKEFAAYVQQAAAPDSDCQAAVLVFGELIANALTHGTGSVRACVGAGAPYAILWVEDGGDGFALGAVRQPVRGRPGGRGILIVNSLARWMRTGPGEGYRFRVTVELPVRLSAS